MTNRNEKVSLTTMSQNEQPLKPKRHTANRKKVEKQIPAEEEEVPQVIETHQKMKMEEQKEEPSLPAMAQEAEIIFEEDNVEVPDFYVEEEKQASEYVEIYQLVCDDGDVYCLTLQEAMTAGSMMMSDKKVFTFEPVDIKITSKRYKALLNTKKYVAAAKGVKVKEEKQAGEKKKSPVKPKIELADGTRVRHKYKDDVWYGVYEKGMIIHEEKVYNSFSGFGATHKRVVSGDESRSCNGVSEVEYFNEETQEWVKGIHQQQV